jgi:hypothetical protein
MTEQAPDDRVPTTAAGALADEAAAHRKFDPTFLDHPAVSCLVCEQDWPCLVSRLADRVTHLERLEKVFRGVASLTRCDDHSGLPTDEQVERIMAPWCRDCLAEDYRALVAGNVQATTMAARYRECSERVIGLAIENHRLRERLAKALEQKP